MYEGGVLTNREAHTLWLQLGAELGFPGVLALIAYYGLCVVRLMPIAKGKVEVTDPWLAILARAVIPSLCGFAVSAQFVSLERLETPYYIALIGAGILKLSTRKPAPINRLSMPQSTTMYVVGVPERAFLGSNRPLAAHVGRPDSFETSRVQVRFMIDRDIMSSNVKYLKRGASRVSVPLIVDSSIATSSGQPITIGIPFARGFLPSVGTVCLVDPLGRTLPVQATPTARWPDGSLKWVLLDFILGPLSPGQSSYVAEFFPEVETDGDRVTQSSMLVEQENGLIAIRSGKVTFSMDGTGSCPLAGVAIDHRPILEPGRSEISLTDRRGRLHHPRVERTDLETVGPVRSTVRFEGSLGGRRDRLQFRTRLSFFADLPIVRMELTLHNPRRARHRGGLWDLGDPGSVFFRDLSIRLRLAGSGPMGVRWTDDRDNPARSSEAERFSIYQGSSGGENWRSRNHVNRAGVISTVLPGYQVDLDDARSFGMRASPVVTLQNANGGLTVAVPRFWEEFPKAIDVEGRDLFVRPFPGAFEDSFELQGGEQKTHTVWFQFDAGEVSESDPLGWVHRPACVRSAPEWYAESRAIPYLPATPLPPDDPRESYFTAVVEGPESVFAKREAIDEYGWRHYGEVYADHEGAYYEGPSPIISHYNNQYDVIHGFLVHFLRTGDGRWSDLLGPLARHVAEIDTYRTRQDRASYNGGLFWHTDHYRDAATCTHRCYSRSNQRPAAGPYGGGPCNEHNYATGLLHYHYLTGDPLAAEAVVGLADWVVAMDDGSRTIFGVIDDGRTGLASSTYSPDYQGPGRGAGNSINVLLDAWLLTELPTYLDKAEELMRRVIHPEDDLAALELLDAERRWSYTVFLSAVDRYLGLKADAGLLDDSYAYAQAAMVHYARWMVEHEAPYLDRTNGLEYPTETWAAQDLRKANVLRLASAHVSEPLGAALIRKADVLADRSWSDLDQFPSRYVTRCLALVMLEGLRDAGLREDPPRPAPRTSVSGGFGSPSAFVSQKQRILARLKSPRGAVRLLVALANPRRLAGRWQGGRGEAAIQT